MDVEQIAPMRHMVQNDEQVFQAFCVILKSMTYTREPLSVSAISPINPLKCWVKNGTALPIETLQSWAILQVSCCYE